jgi:xanthine dehydrogenase accessory factor
VLATVVASYPPQSVRAGAKAVIRGDTIEGWVGGGCIRPVVLQEAREALADGKPRLVRMNAGEERTDPHGGGVRVYPMTCQGEGGVEIYLEPVVPAPQLVVLGETPVAHALVRLAGEAGFDIATSLGELRTTGDAAVVIATMGIGDEEALVSAAASTASYVGLVASRKKAAFLLDFARASGVPDVQLARIKAPAGLDLGGMSPGEIAVSILAEVIQRRHRADRCHPERSQGSADQAGGAEARAERARLQIDESLLRAQRAADFRDPVCGMVVDPATAKHTLVTDTGETIYFCCPHCKARYAKAHA